MDDRVVHSCYALTVYKIYLAVIITNDDSTWPVFFFLKLKRISFLKVAVGYGRLNSRNRRLFYARKLHRDSSVGTVFKNSIIPEIVDFSSKNYTGIRRREIISTKAYRRTI